MIQQRPGARARAACEEFRRLQSAVLDGEATIAERAIVRRHEERCAECRGAREVAERLRHDLRAPVSPLPGDDARDDQLLALLREEGLCRPSPPSDLPESDLRRGRLRGLAVLFSPEGLATVLSADQRRWTQMGRDVLSSICVYLRSSAVQLFPARSAVREWAADSLGALRRSFAPAVATMAATFLLTLGAMRWAMKPTEGPQIASPSTSRPTAPVVKLPTSGGPAFEADALDAWLEEGAPAFASWRRSRSGLGERSKPAAPRRGSLPRVVEGWG